MNGGDHPLSWVGLSVYRSVKSHLTSEASVHPENVVTYSTGNEGEQMCGFFSLPETQHFPHCLCQSFFTLQKNVHALAYARTLAGLRLLEKGMALRG